MGRVPNNSKYLLVGSGRLAKHLKYYFESQSLNLLCWSRNSCSDHDSHGGVHEQSLQSLTTEVDYILLAISDDQINHFIKSNVCLHNKIKVHFSGALEIQDTISLHPLMTFAHELYDVSFYKKIPFVSAIGTPNFSNIFPSLENPSLSIPHELRPLYHALCVISGNFANILWKNSFEILQNELQFELKHLAPYLEKTLENFLSNPTDSLSGPLARGDQKTIDKNIKALTGRELNKIYRSFAGLYKYTEPPSKASHTKQREIPC